MNQTERFYVIDDLLQNRMFVAKSVFLERLEVSLPTFKRDLAYMRERLFAPIEYDRDKDAYTLNKLSPDFARYRLPGLWFNAQEIHAMLTLQRYFEDVSPNLLGAHVNPLRDKLKQLLGTKYNERDVASKIKVVHLGRRSGRNEQFDKVAHALMSSGRIGIRYYSRPRDSYTDREVSPLRLIHYRENWYLDAWCHLTDMLKTFAVDAIDEAWLVNKKAKVVDQNVHDRYVTAGYGIFSGEQVEWAVLRFTPERSRWVAVEEWHPLQIREFDTEDRYVLKLPYSNDHELIMDILKYGPDVEVLAPESLRTRVRERLEAAAKSYAKGGSSLEPAG